MTSGHAALEVELKSCREECESLKKSLKKIAELKRKMEWQRDDAGRQLDELEEKMDVRFIRNQFCVLATCTPSEFVNLQEIMAENNRLRHETQAAKEQVSISVFTRVFFFCLQCF